MQHNTVAVVLAAGLGTRMKSKLPKVLHEVLGQPMVNYPVQIALDAGCSDVAVVVGYRRELVETRLRADFPDLPVSFHVQKEMRGTADAVRSARHAFAEGNGDVLILYGDVPNLPPEEIEAVVELHRSGGSPITLLTAHDPTPNQYGKLVRDEAGHAQKIVEYKDADDTVRALTEVNIGVYLVDAEFLREGLDTTGTDNAAGEFYLTDLIEMAYQRETPALVRVAPDIDALHGVNNRAQLGEANRYAQRRLNRGLMESGVTMRDPESVWVDARCTIEPDVMLEPGVQLLGTTRVGSGATIEGPSRLENVEVAAQERVPAFTSRSNR